MDQISSSAGSSGVELDSYTNTESATARQLVAIDKDNDDSVVIADPTDPNKMPAIGFVYYLDAATPGDITATAPSGSGDVVYMVGVAKSATEMIFMPPVPLRGVSLEGLMKAPRLRLRGLLSFWYCPWREVVRSDVWL
jgi:hypothetical protein